MLPSKTKSLSILRSKKGQLSSSEKMCLFEIMRLAYAETEHEIWGRDYRRMEFEEYHDIVESELILYAKIEDTIAGSLHFKSLKNNNFSFSLLSTDPAFRGLGVASRLIDEVEKMGTNKGAEFIQLEILRARDFEIESKTVLKNWYEQKGYKFIKTKDFALVRPEKKAELLVPCQFDYYRKFL
jgi:GNAT superfamily N-acetyltransferase